MADKVLFQGAGEGDNLSEQNLTEAAAKSNQTDYVERGLSLTHDDNDDTLDVGSGHAVIETVNNEAYDVFPDSRSGLSLTSSDVNHVFLEIDPDTDDDISIHIDTDDSAPTNPSLKLGTVDTNKSAPDSVNELNDNPDGDFDSLSTERIYSNSRSAEVVVWNDNGTVVAESAGETIDTDSDIGQVLQSVDANISQGGDVFIRKGDYTSDTNVVINTDGVRLVGEGCAWPQADSPAAYGSAIRASANTTSSEPLIQLDGQFTGVEQLGLSGEYNVQAVVKCASDNKDYVVRNCGIKDGETYCVHARGKNNWIIDNWMEFAHYANLRISGGAQYHKTLVRGNMFVGVDDSAGNGHIVRTGGEEVRILGNTFNRGGLGIWDFGSVGIVDDIIADNVFRGIGRDPSPESFSDFVLYSQAGITGTTVHSNRVKAKDNNGTTQTAHLAGFASDATVSNVKFYGNNDTNLSGSRIVDNGNSGYTVGSNAV